MDRFDNSGDAQNGFWFFQNQVSLTNNKSQGGFTFSGLHKNGDLLIVSDFSNGGTTATIGVYKWDTACTAASKPTADCADSNLRLLQSSSNANCATSQPSAPFCGIVNSANGVASPWAYTDKSGNSTFLNGEFYEGGINLSAFPGLAQECFASSLAESRSSTSTSAVLKSFVLSNFGNCSSSLTTTAKDGSGGTIPGTGLSIGGGSITVKDSANLNVGGAAVWSGSIAFFLCGPSATDTCASGGTSVGSVNVDNATTQPVLSPAATVTSAGRYCWRAVFTSNTSGVPGASDNGSNPSECFTVNPVTPSITTNATSAAVTIGGSIADTATLSGTATEPGGSPAAGSITFRAYGPSATPACTSSTLAFTSNAIPVTGDGVYGPVSFVPTSAGTYYWVASYSGDLPNTNGATTACGDNNETSVISPVQPTLTTTATAGPVVLTNPLDDTAHLNGTALEPDGVTKAKGTITFNLYGPASSTTDGTTLLGTSVVNVSGDGDYKASAGSVTSGTLTPTAVGIYNWTASYSGDAPNTLGVSTVCGDADESTTVIKLPSTITTAQSWYPQDSATVGGGGGGTVTFTLYKNDSTCSSSSAIVYASGAVSLVSGAAATSNSSFAVTSVASGGDTYYWQASYSGDSTHKAVSSCVEATNFGSLANGGPVSSN